jgi:hypothetical protein
MKVAAEAAPLVAPARKAREVNVVTVQSEWEGKVVLDLKGWRGGYG